VAADVSERETERLGFCLNVAQLQHRTGSANIGQDRQPSDTRNDLAQQLKALAGSIDELDR